MRLLHLSDLHIGKNLGNFSLLEDQIYVLDQILEIIRERKIEAVMVAGDIFDTAVASAEALDLYNYFIEKIIFDIKIPVLAISGNHDSAKRLDINKRFYKTNRYYLAGEYTKDLVTLEDEYGPVHFFLLPFMSLAKGRTIFDGGIKDFTDLYRLALKDYNYKDRNVLITHCYASKISEGLEKAYNEGQKPLTIGGSDMMNAALFMDFDYTALGHLHSAHFVLDPKIRYSGTFMPYSFDKKDRNKSVTLVDLKKETVEIEKIPVKLLREFEVREGFFDDLIREEPSDSYIKFILEDKATVENAMAKFKKKFPNAVLINYKSRSVFNMEDKKIDIDVENKSTLDLFKDFISYKDQRDLTDSELRVVEEVIGDINEG
ncbi:exonuclease SbcCD subunit D [uncultured Anaerococcus sp.]|uniref:exonuclease SbcCD subunit D n=1 Tax=uncultured Anaerococcus sp. TaxID=293428 RepID=UPI0025D9B97C|nr:exonuclease SbcCD subunit D [uncultured Anaerococcus sp.]